MHTSRAATNHHYDFRLIRLLQLDKVINRLAAKMSENGEASPSEPKVIYSNCMTCLTNSEKPKDIKFIGIKQKSSKFSQLGGRNYRRHVNFALHTECLLAVASSTNSVFPLPLFCFDNF